jgi:hypothetical protein
MRQAAFAIPFAVPPADQEGKEVLLFVSADQARTWTLYSRQTAAAGQFAFQAAQDGEFWFASHTVPAGAAMPAGTRFVPELKVIVDTGKPALDVQAVVNRNGEIQVTWEASDPFILADSLRIEYQGALGQAWKAIEVNPATRSEDANALRGQTAWQPEGGGRFVSIRVEVQDTAGNVQQAIRRLLIPSSVARSASPAPGMIAAADVPADPLASHGLASVPLDGTGDSAAAVDAEPAPAAMPVARNAYSLGAEATDAAADAYTASPAAESGPPATTTNWPSDAQEGWDSQPGGRQNANFTSSSAVDPAANQNTASGNRAAAKSAESDPTAGQESQSSAAAAPRPDTADRYGLPPGERPRMTRTTRFNLAYSVDAAGPMGLDKVELWVTRNGGRDWNLWGTDEDMQSPFLVEVEREGIYGFRVVLVSKNGLASQTPRAGDLADLWVGIDTTSPVAEITSAAYGSGPHAGHLDVQWTATDDHLGPRPITLAFSEQPDGPWTTIASGLPNDGQYFWRVDAGVPDQFYLRLEVRDEAGNETVDRLDQAIQSAGLTPKGRVSDFQPLFE